MQQCVEVEGPGWKMKRKGSRMQNSSLWHLKSLVWAKMEREKKKKNPTTLPIWESTKGLTQSPWGHNSLSLQKLWVLPLIMYNFSFLKPRHIFSFSQPTSNMPTLCKHIFSLGIPNQTLIHTYCNKKESSDLWKILSSVRKDFKLF